MPSPHRPAPSHSESLPFRWVWWTAVGGFVVAASTGALFRFGVAYGWTGPLELENIRHAHSHLMYFGWATPALMALIWRLLPVRITGPHEIWFQWIVGATLASAFLAYPPFLLFGYSPVQMGAVRMPVAVVGAGLNIVGWYGFAALYAVATQTLDRTGPVLIWDVALVFLVLATLGAWGLALLKPVGLHDPFAATALTHVFLDLFSEGWFVLGVLGVAVAVIADRPPPSWALGVIGTGLPLAFILSLPPSGLSVSAQWAGRLGATAVGGGLAVVAVHLLAALTQQTSGAADRWLWSVPLGLLLAKAAAQLLAGLWPGAWLSTHHGLRILYLHVMLLGFVSLGLVAAARTVWRGDATPGAGWLYGAVGAVLASLLPLTDTWPFVGWWAGHAPYVAAAWTSLLPIAAALGMLGRGLFDAFSHRQPQHQ